MLLLYTRIYKHEKYTWPTKWFQKQPIRNSIIRIKYEKKARILLRIILKCPGNGLK